MHCAEQIDPAGALPVWIVNLVSVEQALNAGRARERMEYMARANQTLDAGVPSTGAGDPANGNSLLTMGWCKDVPISDLIVPARRVVRLPVRVQRRSLARFCFCCFGGDISFCIEGLRNHQTATSSRYPGVPAGAASPTGTGVVSAQVVLEPGVEYNWCWDNTSSWTSKRQVPYKFDLQPLGTS